MIMYIYSSYRQYLFCILATYFTKKVSIEVPSKSSNIYELWMYFEFINKAIKVIIDMIIIF